MAYLTVISLKVLILLLGTTEGIKPEQPRHEYSVVAKVLQKFFDTYNTYSNPLMHMRADDTGAKSNLTVKEVTKENVIKVVRGKPKQTNSLEHVIKLKIQALKPYLEDNSTINDQGNTKNKVDEDNNVTLEGDEETTIIEFLPTEDNTKQALRIKEEPPRFKDNVQKYKKMRDNIKHILIKESVSVKSQKLVISTLDSMLGSMVRSQCPANSGKEDIYRENLRAGIKIAENKDLTKNWTKKWNTIRDKYNKIWMDHFPKQPNPARKLFMFFEQIQDFLTTVINDSDYISNNYKVVCKLVKYNDKEVINFNDDNLFSFRSGKNKKQYKCPNFKVCSKELQDFMKRFYRKLNDTVGHTFQNYAAMYTSDITSDGSGEKEFVIEAVNKSGNAAKHKIKRIFKSLTSTFELDHNKNPDENMKRLKAYVYDVIEKSLTSIKNTLAETDVNDSIKERLITNVRQDLSANIDVDLGNLKSEAKKEICRDFSSCNGKIIIGKLEEMASRRNMPIDKNKVYVKLQLTLDKDLKEKIAKEGMDYFDGSMKNNYLRTKSPKLGVTRTTLKLKKSPSITLSTNKGNYIKQYPWKDAKISTQNTIRPINNVVKSEETLSKEKLATYSTKRSTDNEISSNESSSTEKKKISTGSNIRSTDNYMTRLDRDAIVSEVSTEA